MRECWSCSTWRTKYTVPPAGMVQLADRAFVFENPQLAGNPLELLPQFSLAFRCARRFRGNHSRNSGTHLPDEGFRMAKPMQ
jgi:hypothetical protein